MTREHRDGEYPVAVSILMPAYNASTTLDASVASVCGQKFESWELLIVDDASQDDTYTLAIQAAGRDPRIRVIRHPENHGAAEARNSALAIARGRWIAFLDADDLWMPDKLAKQIAFMEKTGAALSYTGFWRERMQPERNRGTKTEDPRASGLPMLHIVTVPASVTRTDLLRGNVIGCLTACYDRKHLGSVPMPLLRLRQDFALWLDILTSVEQAWGLNEPLAVHRTRKNSLSSGRLRTAYATWSMYRRHLNLSRPQAAYYLGNHIIRRIFRR